MDVVSDYPYTASIHPRDIIERDFRDPSSWKGARSSERVAQLYGVDLD
jgi:hypothetical protein